MNEKPPWGFWAGAGAVVYHRVMADSRMVPGGVSLVFIMSGFRLQPCGGRGEKGLRVGVENVAADVSRVAANSEIEN
jgi:cysteine sulfinate desulfinase/cysteine desulfurase-like protein